MAETKGFEDLIVWQKAKESALYVYDIFKNHKDFSFKQQIERASVSVMNNIAEGYERKSKREFVQFFVIAKGSSGEVRSMLILAFELGYITKKDYDYLYSLMVQISKILSSFIKKYS